MLSPHVWSRALVDAVAAILLFTLAVSAFAEDADSCADFPSLGSIYADTVGAPLAARFGESSPLTALLAGEADLRLLLGYEYVDQDNTSEHAEGLTLRSRLSYKTRVYNSLQAKVEWQHVNNHIEEFLMPGGRGGRAGHDLIADVDGNRIHQAYLDFTGIPDTRLRYGIQEVRLDNQRFFGNVGWRMQAQSFQGATIENTALEGLTLTGAYLTRALNIFKETQDTFDEIVIVHSAYKVSDTLTATGFGYLVDGDAGANDSATYGLSVAGALDAVDYRLTGAWQQDYADGPDRDATFLDAFVAGKLGDVTLGAGYSRLSGGTTPFDTLFSTAHAFNGWADVFLASNGGGLTGGLQDAYLQADATFGKVSVGAFYHRFYTTQEVAGFDGLYGQEIDLVAKVRLCKRATLTFKYALYDEADQPALNPTSDKQVFWTRLQLAF